MPANLPGADQWPEISRLLDEALALEVRERDAWLEALACDCPETHACLRDLLATLGEIERDDFLDELPWLDVPEEPFPTELRPGQAVSVYRLLREIGVGGMGTVWLAERTDGVVQRRLALKLPRTTWGGRFAERLARESRILATLEHEHIARLYDAGVDGQGRPFLALEYVAGLPIDVYCRENAVSLRQREELLLQTMAAVSHAHARLVVHRDLKPANILVTSDGRVKLLDFGIAKLLESDRAEATALTRLAGRALTLDYASPEQIRGEPLGTASDVYSLGVVAYELLSDAKPYRLRRGSAAEMEEAIANAQPLLASEAATAPARRSALRGDLDAILNRALKKSVDERYPSIDAFAQDLARHMRGEPVHARPDSRWYRASKFVSRHRGAVVLASTLAASVVVGSGVSIWQGRVARLQERRAVSETLRQQAVRDLYDETMMALSMTATEHPETFRRPHVIMQALEDKLQETAPRYSERPVERAAQLEAVMLQLNYDNEFEASLNIGVEYLAHLKAHGGTPDQIITAYSVMGRDLAKLKRFDECEAVRRAGFEWAPEADDELTALSRLKIASDLGNVLVNQGKRTEALEVITRAEAIAAKRPVDQAAHFENGLVLINYYLGFDEAKELTAARRSYEGLQGVTTRSPDDRANYARWYGTALLDNGQPAKAEAVLRQSQTLYNQTYGASSRNSVTALARTVQAISLQGDYARAERMIDEASASLSAVHALPPFTRSRLLERRLDNAWLAGDVPALRTLVAADTTSAEDAAALRDDLALLEAKARALALLGRDAEALDLMEAVRDHWPGRDRATSAWIGILQGLAQAQLSAQRPREARATARALAAIFQGADAQHGRGALVAGELDALASVRLGDRDAATQALRRLDQLQPSPSFASDVERSESLLRRSEILSRLGRGAEAAAMARAASALLTTQHPASPRNVQLREALAGCWNSPLQVPGCSGDLAGRAEPAHSSTAAGPRAGA